MKTVIIGGGRGCEAIIDLATSTFLKELTLDIECVMDIDPEAPGIQRARELRIETCTDLDRALSTEGVELVIELTGRDDVLEHIHRIVRPGVTLVDHTFAHIFWDLVSAQQEREWQLHQVTELEHRFKSFIDSAHDWISIKDAQGRYVIVNPVCAHAFDKEPDDFVGRHPDEVLPPEVCRTIAAHDRRVVECDCHQTFEEVYLLHGRERHFQTVRFPLTDHHGNTMGVCTIARDVTAERELRDQLVQAAKLAAVGKLAAGVAHEINNPLTGVLAFAEDMLDDLLEGHPHREDLGVIIRETMRCREIVRNLLDFARLEKLVLVEVSPNEIIEQALKLVHRLPQFRNISIRKRLDASLPPIKCDTKQLHQVVLNMMMNSADAMNGAGEIKLATRYRKQTDRCVISIEDTGPGIPDDLLERIFEPFFTTKGTSGLGLAVSRGIIERHNGTIETARARSGGAIFRIVLPAGLAPGS